MTRSPLTGRCRLLGTHPLRIARVAPLFAVLMSVSIAATAQDTGGLRVTLKQAVELALKNNLGVLLAKTEIDEVAGTRARRVAALLPRASADSFINWQNRNLAVAGLSIPGVPPVVGPYAFMDFRVSASQVLIDREAYHDWKASARVEAGAASSYQDVRDLVIREAAGLYLASQSTAAEVEAAGARSVTSIALEKLAEDQRDQGLATGLDVVRAQVQVARDHQNVLVTQNAYRTSLLSLARFIGLDLGQPLELAESLTFDHVSAPAVEDALPGALAVRADYQALLAQRDALDEQPNDPLTIGVGRGDRAPQDRQVVG